MPCLCAKGFKNRSTTGTNQRRKNLRKLFASGVRTTIRVTPQRTQGTELNNPTSNNANVPDSQVHHVLNTNRANATHQVTNVVMLEEDNVQGVTQSANENTILQVSGGCNSSNVNSLLATLTVH